VFAVQPALSETPAMDVVESLTDSPVRPVDVRAVRAATQLGRSSTEIERLPFDLSVLDDGGIFCVRRATCG
jgi:hypothetical protein